MKIYKKDAVEYMGTTPSNISELVEILEQLKKARVNAYVWFACEKFYSYFDSENDIYFRLFNQSKEAYLKEKNNNSSNENKEKSIIKNVVNQSLLQMSEYFNPEVFENLKKTAETFIRSYASDEFLKAMKILKELFDGTDFKDIKFQYGYGQFILIKRLIITYRNELGMQYMDYIKATKQTPEYRDYGASR